MFLGEPNRGCGGGGGEDDFDLVNGHDVHDATEPEEIVFAFFGFAEAPGKFADADDIDTHLGHEGGIFFPGSLGIIGTAGIGIDPMLRVIINAKIHKVYGLPEL